MSEDYPARFQHIGRERQVLVELRDRDGSILARYENSEAIVIYSHDDLEDRVIIRIEVLRGDPPAT